MPFSEHTIKDINPNLINLIPTIDQRRSQIELLNKMDKERNSSREFLFPEENSLRRRKSSIEFPAVQSDEEDETFEVICEIKFHIFNFYRMLTSFCYCSHS